MNAFIVVIFKLQGLFLKQLLQLQNGLGAKMASYNFYWSQGFARQYKQLPRDLPIWPLLPYVRIHLFQFIRLHFIYPFTLSTTQMEEIFTGFFRTYLRVPIKCNEHRTCCCFNACIYLVLMSFQNESSLFKLCTYTHFQGKQLFKTIQLPTVLSAFLHLCLSHELHIISYYNIIMLTIFDNITVRNVFILLIWSPSTSTQTYV